MRGGSYFRCVDYGKLTAQDVIISVVFLGGLTMVIDYAYSLYEADVSGSRSKNRFSYEIYWGIDRFLRELIDSDDFTMVFDYVCDVEIHHRDRLEFFQVKSKKDAGSYTVKALTRKEPSKQHSIIGTLYKLRHTEIENNMPKSKLAIVSNLHLGVSDNLRIPNSELMLETIEEKNRSIFLSAISAEFPDEEIDLSDVFFINSDLGISTVRETMIGRVESFFVQFYSEDPVKPGALLSLLIQEALEKANYEFPVNSRIEAVEKKGITSERFKLIIGRYAEQSVSIMEQCKKYIQEAEKNLGKRLKYMTVLPDVISRLRMDFHWQELEGKITDDILEQSGNLESAQIFELVRQYVGISTVTFPLEFSLEEIELFCLIVMIKVEESL